MSRENVKKFYEMLKVDANLAQELMKLKEELEKGDKKFLNDEYVINEKIIPLAKKHGLDFTADEFTSVSTKLLNKLDEEDLLKVSGGGPLGRAVAALMSFLQSFIPMPVGYNEINVTDTAQVIQAEGQQSPNIPTPETEESEPQNQENEIQPLVNTLSYLANIACQYVVKNPYDDRLRQVSFWPIDKDFRERLTHFLFIRKADGYLSALDMLIIASFAMNRFPLGRQFLNNNIISKSTTLIEAILGAAKSSADEETLGNLKSMLEIGSATKDVFVALVYHLLAYRVGGIRNVGFFNYDETLNAVPELKIIFDSANVEELRAILGPEPEPGTDLQSNIPIPVGYKETNVTDTAQVIQAEGQQSPNIPTPETEESELEAEETEPETEENEESELETEESEPENKENETLSLVQSFIPMPVGYNEINVTDTAQVIQAEGQQSPNIPTPETEESEPQNQENETPSLVKTLLKLAYLVKDYESNEAQYLDYLLSLGGFSSEKMIIGSNLKLFNAVNVMKKFPLGEQFIRRLDPEKPVKSAIDVFLKVAQDRSINESSSLEELRSIVNNTMMGIGDRANINGDVFVSLVYHLLAYRVGEIRSVDNFYYYAALSHPNLWTIFNSANVEELRAILEQ